MRRNIVNKGSELRFIEPLGKLIHNNGLLLIDELWSTYFMPAFSEIALISEIYYPNHFFFVSV